MKYYSYRTCSTTPIFLPLFADFNWSQRLGDFFLGGAWRYWEYDGSKWTDLTSSSALPMTAKADGEALIMDGFVRSKGGAGDRMKADGVERFRILTRKRKNIEKIIGKLTQKS